MRPVVVDASIGIAMVRDEPGGAAAKAAIQAWKRAGRRLVVPSHFWLEIANSLMRRHRWPGTEVLGAIYDLDRSRFQTIRSDRANLLLALDGAERYGLSMYDAAYLALADSIDGEVLTFDQALKIAAGDRAITLGHQLSETQVVYERDVTWPNYKGASAYLAKLRAEALRPTS